MLINYTRLSYYLYYFLPRYRYLCS